MLCCDRLVGICDVRVLRRSQVRRGARASAQGEVLSCAAMAGGERMMTMDAILQPRHVMSSQRRLLVLAQGWWSVPVLQPQFETRHGA